MFVFSFIRKESEEEVEQFLDHTTYFQLEQDKKGKETMLEIETK